MALHFQSFSSFEEMQDHLDKMRARADATVNARQAQVKIGECFMRYDQNSGLVIYGEVLDPSKPVPPYDKNLSKEDLEEIAWEGERYKSPEMKHTRFCKCFSQADHWTSTEGELGNVHVSTMDMIIPREMLEHARNAGWPNDLSGQELMDVMNKAGYDWQTALAATQRGEPDEPEKAP